MNTLILTICDHGNYGNRLQHYALYHTLKRYGSCASIMSSQRISNLPSYICRKHLSFLIDIWHDFNFRGLPWRYRRKRRRSFNAFEPVLFAQDFFLSPFHGFEGRINDDYRIIIGSDQVWNYTFNVTKEDIELRLGMFAEPERLISYAASIGLDDIDEEWRPIFREGWSRIPCLSVREDQAAELVREIVGREAAVVLDPTLMLTIEQWSEVFTGFVPEGERYVLTYFLGKPTESQREAIEACARGWGLTIRRLNDPSDPLTYAAGPGEFVELFSKAECVFTDSYHACCFSILFNRPFQVFNRSGISGKTNMNSRMRTLARLFELDSLLDESVLLPEFDWARVNELLSVHRNESLAWLERALGVSRGGGRDA